MQEIVVKFELSDTVQESPTKTVTVWKHGSSVVSALAFGARTQRLESLLFRIRTLTGCYLCREIHPLCNLKNPTVI